jgi:hypothetical protein
MTTVNSYPHVSEVSRPTAPQLADRGVSLPFDTTEAIRCLQHGASRFQV